MDEEDMLELVQHYSRKVRVKVEKIKVGEFSHKINPAKRPAGATSS